MKPDPENLGDVADAVLEGHALDWKELESTAAPETRGVILQFRIIAQIADVRRQITVEPEWWGHLKVGERLGAGAFGEVFRAWDSRLEREVALKLLRNDREPAGVLREARLLARIRHPNIVTVFDAAEFEERAGFWMELVQGRPLEEGIRERGPLPAPEVLRLAIELCGALAAVHAAGLLHRDVKAQNVIRTADGRVVLMDFGAGDELVSIEPVSQQSVGTPLYLAPEILSGGAATPLSDIYSLGVLLFRVATDSYPVKGSTIDELRAAHNHGLRTRLLDLTPAFPRDLARVIDRALEADPSRRFPSASDLAGALERIEHRLMHAGRRRMLLAAALSSLLVAFFILAPVARPWRQSLLQRAGLLTAANPSIIAGQGPRQIQTPDMSLLGAVSMDDRVMSFSDVNQNLGLRDMGSRQDHVLVKSGEDGYAYHSWPAPDSSQVAYSWFSTACQCMDLRTVPTSGGEPAVLVHDEQIWELFLAGWTADQQKILASAEMKSGEHRMLLVSTDGSVRVLKSSPLIEARILSPDGRYVAYSAPSIASPNTNTVFILSTDDGTDSPLLEDGTNNGNALWSPDGAHLLYSSDRSNATSLWKVPVIDGKAAGAPTLVRKDLGRITNVSLTSSGSLYYTEQTGIVDIYTAKIDLQSKRTVDGPRQIISRNPGSNLAPDWSRDGKFLAYLSMPRASGRQRRLLTVQSQTSEAEFAVPVGMTFMSVVRWSPDGRHAVVKGFEGSQDVRLYLVDMKSGATEKVLIKDEDFGWPLWNPDGRRIYLVMGESRKSITSLDTQTLERREIYRDKQGIDRQIAISADGGWVAFSTREKEQRVLKIVPGQGGIAVELLRTDRAVEVAGFSGKYLLFGRRDDPAGLASGKELWAIRIDGGEAFSLGLRMDSMGGFTMHPDGKTIAFTVGVPGTQTSILPNLLPR